MLGNLDRARIVLTGLRRLGISIALDDFGSGYSSLYYLNELPIDEVKLDRSLIASITEIPVRRRSCAPSSTSPTRWA